MKSLELYSKALEDRSKERRNLIELFEIERLPGDLRIFPEVRFMLLAECVHRRVHILKAAVCRVLDNAGPRLVRFSQRHRIRVANATVAPQSLIG
jgi:hypothetical protein